MSPYVKACELVSAADIKRIANLPVGTGVTTTDFGGDSQCEFRQDTVGLVMVTVHGQGSIEPYRKVPGQREVPGIGDAAVWHEGNAQLAVKRGESVFSISFLKPPAKRKWAIELARIALPKFNEDTISH